MNVYINQLNRGVMSIYVKHNGLVYDESNKDCKCYLYSSQGLQYAFIQVLDGNFKKRYWGVYDHSLPSESIKAIIDGYHW